MKYNLEASLIKTRASSETEREALALTKDQKLY